MQQPRAGAFVSAGVLFIAAAVLMYGHGELTATRAELGAARAHLLALSSRLSALEAASANSEPRMAPERRRAQHEELGGGCLSSDEIAVSALDSAFAVSNALAGFMSNILPGLQSSKVQCDLFAAGVQPELESAAAGFSSFNESVRPGLEEAKEAYEAFAAEEQPQLQLAAEGFNSFNESVRPDLESSKALFDSLHPGRVLARAELLRRRLRQRRYVRGFVQPAAWLHLQLRQRVCYCERSQHSGPMHRH